MGRVGGAVRRLNWGCGPHCRPGWVNADRLPAPGVDVIHDVRNGVPLATDIFDYAVAIHVLQDIAYPELLPALGELRRVLRPGGVLRLGLPDLDRAIRAYLAGDAGYFYVSDADARTLGGKLAVQISWYGSVRTPFTYAFAAELLERAGFAAVHACAFGVTRSRHGPAIVELDNRERESFFVEAVK